MKTHSDTKPFVCPHTQCNGRGFYRKEQFQNHLALQHGAAKRWPCTLCSKGYTSRSMLEDHVRSVHSKATPFQCRYCFKSFSRGNSRRDHEKRHTSRHVCEKCGWNFTEKAGLMRHKCGSSGKGGLQRSRKVVPPALRPYSCDICSSSFSRQSNLKFHLKLHSPSNPHICTVCMKPFLCAAYLATHQQVHLVAIQDSGNQCSDGNFTTYVREQTSVPLEQEQREFSCNNCDAKFSCELSLKKHQSLHHPIKLNLRRHAQMHLADTHKKASRQHKKITRKRFLSKMKPFVCTECSSSFNLVNTLIKHLKLHSID